MVEIFFSVITRQAIRRGNFTSVNAQSRSQIAKIDVSGPTYALSTWSTPQFTNGCSTNFESYVMGVEYSPNGQFLCYPLGCPPCRE